MKINKIELNLEYDNGIKQIVIMPDEIKRLHKIIDGMIDNEKEYCLEINRLNNIIKEVREFIIDNMGYYSDRLEFKEYTERYVKDLNKIMNLLNKGE